MKEMCHKEITGNICSEQCQDTARRMVYMGKILGKIRAKKILEICKIINKKGQNNCKKMLE
jgi:hypothetical protein